MQKLYQEITDRISAELEKGVVPWRRDWTSTDAGIPANALTAHVYRGVNVPLLWLAQQRHSWPTLNFVTFKQARELGGTVRGGQKSTGIVFTKPLEVEDKASGEKKTIHMLRWYWVFNVAQCGLPDKITNPEATRKPINPDIRDAEIDAFVTASEVPVFEGKGSPAYLPAVDHVRMPKFDDFETAHGFYAALLHETTHATGHATRCNRTMSAKPKLYAAEELIAELGASFLCAEFGIDHTQSAASYIDHWLKLLRDDAKAFVRAASAAQASCDWLRGKALAETREAA